MLEHLVRVDDIEGGIVEPKGIDITDLEREVPALAIAVLISDELDHRRCCVDPDDLAWSGEISELCGDGAGTAAHIEQRHPGGEVGSQERRGVGHRPPSVAAEH